MTLDVFINSFGGIDYLLYADTMIDFHTKRLILAGAGSVIARSFLDIVLAGGGRCALIDRDDGALREIVAREPSTSAVQGFVADISDPSAVARAIDQAHTWLGGIDGLVNCAAILMPEDGLPHTTAFDTWETTLATNLTGTFLTCHACLPHMLKGGGGAIVNMSSVVAHNASAQAQIAYTSAKGGVEAMTREIAIAYARARIRANLVAAGPVKTPRTAHYFDTPEKWQARRAHIPMGRLGTSTEIAAVIAFLLSDAASYITGSTYFADGGIHAAYLVDDRNGDTDS